MATKIADQIKNILNPFATEVGKDIKKLTDSKQDKLKPGLNITISPDGTISSTGAGEAPDLSNYPTTQQVGTIVDGKLADYVKTEALANYVQTATLTTTLADYAKTEALANYVQTTALTTALEPYAKTEALDAYVKTDALDTKLQPYAKTEALADFVTTTSLTNGLEPYAKKDEVVKTADLEGLDTFNLVEVYNTAKTQG
nr:MAG TPA: hypothetical protein [Caudoviricetes sp.]